MIINKIIEMKKLIIFFLMIIQAFTHNSKELKLDSDQLKAILFKINWIDESIPSKEL